jgi:Uncharacterized protein conserved in bacteria (DUF2125)
MNFSNPVKRHHMIATVAGSAAAVAVLWIIWFVGATRYQGVVDDWIRIGRDQGYEISFDRREQFGFPSHTVLRFTNVRWKNTNGIEFHAGDLDISADFFQTKKFKAKFKGQVQLDAPVASSPYSLTLGGEGGEVDVELSDAGIWQDCSIAMKVARLGRSPDYIFFADTIKLSSQRPADEPKGAKIAGLTLSAEADDVTLPAAMPPSFGPKMPKLQIDLRLMGPIPDFREKDSVMAWNKMNGLVEFDRLNVEWGPLLAHAKGAMNFDDDLQPEGAFSATIGHPDQVVERLTRGGFIAATQQNMLNSAMRYLAKPIPIDGLDGIEVPIAIQLGGFFLGPIKIFAFSPIEWD